MVKSDQHRQNELIITSTVLTAISALIVLTRWILRGIVIRKPGWDDGLMLGALIGTIGYLVCLYVLKSNHAGFPMTTLSMDNMLGIIQATLAIQVIYYTIVACVKISILCMYLRIAVSQTMRTLVFATIALHAAFFVICISGTLAQCQPLKKMWDFTGAVEGSCINTTAFFYFTSGFNILTDIWILALPIKTLIHINRPKKEKIALIGIFTVGAFATITSIIRLHSIYTFTEAKDPFHESLLVNLWSMIEVNAGIICASVPALKPLFTPHKLRQLSQESSFKYPSQTKSKITTSHTSDEKPAELGSWEMPPVPNRAEVHGNSSDSTNLILQR